MASVKLVENGLELRCSYEDREKAKIVFGYKWNADSKCWNYPINIETFLQLKQSFPDIIIEEAVTQRFLEEENRIRNSKTFKSSADPDVEDYPHKELIESLQVKNLPRSYQKIGVSYILSHDAGMIFDEMGCISGDAEIRITRRGVEAYTLKELHEKFHDESWRKRDHNYRGPVDPSKLKIRTASVTDQGALHINDIEDVIYKGKKETYCVKAKGSSGKYAGNYSLRATLDHRFLTSHGEYKQLKDLRVGDTIFSQVKKLANTKDWLAKPTKITSIGERRREEDVYDITMKAPCHNFVANGLVVHNCGKTFQAMMGAIARKQLGQIKRCLVVCPATLKGTWYREISKHTYEHGIVVDGNKKERKNQMEAYMNDEKYLFLIINYESLRVDGMKMKFDMIISDECVRIKNPKAYTTKAVKKIEAQYRIGLSGYPIANKIEDIWSQIDWIRPGYLGNRWQFEDRYMIKQAISLRPRANETKQRQFKQVVGYRNLKELHEKLTPLYIRRLKKDVLKDLPPKIYQTREVELSGEQMTKYARMKTEMRVMVEDMYEQEVQAKARTILVQLLRLSQITGGFITDISLDAPYWMKENSKLDELDKLLEEIVSSGNKCVLWSRFVPMIHKLYDRYNMKYNAVYLTGSVPVKDRDRMIQDFQNNDDIKIFVGQIQSGGMGITLHAANYEVFIDKAFVSPSSILQAEDRCIAEGQLILTPNGYVPIETIKKGDFVIGKSGKSCKVLDCWNNITTRKMVEIEVEEWPHPIICTYGHWFLINTLWVKAEYIVPGDMAAMPGEVPNKQISSIKHRFHKNERVYDLTVEDDESFIVGRMIAHNCHRMGQTKSVNVITLIAKNTVDMHWENLLQRKKHLAQQLIGDSPGWDLKKEDVLEILK